MISELLPEIEKIIVEEYWRPLNNKVLLDQLSQFIDERKCEWNIEPDKSVSYRSLKVVGLISTCILPFEKGLKTHFTSFRLSRKDG